jgi:hypothetical protein
LYDAPVERLKRIVGSYSVTPVGVVVLVMLVAAVVLAALGSKSLQVPALIVALLSAALIAAGGFPGGTRGRAGGFAARRAEFRPRNRRIANTTSQTDADNAELWRRERERRERDGRG